MSYIEGQVFKILLQHQWSDQLGGCISGCGWVMRDADSGRVEHAEHVAQELAISGLLAESRKSIATIKAQALYEVAEQLCRCTFDKEEDLFHDEECPTWILNKRADRLR